MAYLDNEDKIRGKNREPIIAKRIQEDLRDLDYDVTSRKSMFHEDVIDKYDYEFKFTNGKLFEFNGINKHSIKVDIKSGESFTLIDTRGKNTLENSKSDFIVFELYPNTERLLWVDTESLRECLGKNYPILRESKYNESQYFFIESYVKANKNVINFKYI